MVTLIKKIEGFYMLKKSGNFTERLKDEKIDYNTLICEMASLGAKIAKKALKTEDHAGILFDKMSVVADRLVAQTHPKLHVSDAAIVMPILHSLEHSFGIKDEDKRMEIAFPAIAAMQDKMNELGLAEQQSRDLH